MTTKVQRMTCLENKREVHHKASIKKSHQNICLYLFADMLSETELPMRIHEEVHFKTPSSENNDEKSKTSPDTEGPTQVETDRSEENTLPSSQTFSTDYSLSSQDSIAQKGKKQVICSLMQQLRKKLDSKVTSHQVLTYFYL